ncbi:MAG: hypothetical protein HQK68_00185 [Desulfamplus sp.]|nr:hypothetical protein [Desulfamplus sp.]
MSYSFEDIWSLSVAELQRRGKQRAYEYGTLYNKFVRLEAVLKEKKERLSSLNSQMALIDKQLKDSKNSKFILNKKRTEMEDALILLKGAVSKKEALLFELNGKKKRLESRIKELNKTILEASKEIATVAKTNNINKKKIVSLKKERTILSTEISKFLSATSIERDEFEKKAQDLNNEFVLSLTERSDVKNRLTAIKKEIESTFASIDMFKNQIESMAEIKKLQESIIQKAKEQRSLSVRYSELQIELINKQGQFDSVASMVETQQNQIASISDDNLIKIDKALSELNEHKKRVADLSEEQNKALDELLDIMVQKAVLEENYDTIWQNIESLEFSILELAQ